MSQEKVDAYKKEKKGRKQRIEKQKKMRKLAKVICLIILVAAVAGIGGKVAYSHFAPEDTTDSATESSSDILLDDATLEGSITVGATTESSEEATAEVS